MQGKTSTRALDWMMKVREYSLPSPAYRLLRFPMDHLPEPVK